MKHCFVKQEAINTFSEKCPILYNLHRWKQLGRAQHMEARARAREKINIDKLAITQLARPDPVLPGVTFGVQLWGAAVSR